MKIKRRDTSVEAVGAEHLVMGYLMRKGIQTYLADQRQEGYDLICVNPQNNKMLKIQVKSRWAIDCDRAFPLNNSNSDFIAVVFLNCGYMNKKRKNDAPKELEIYMIPTKKCIEVQRKEGWQKVYTREIEKIESFKWDFERVKKKLGM